MISILKLKSITPHIKLQWLKNLGLKYTEHEQIDGTEYRVKFIKYYFKQEIEEMQWTHNNKMTEKL